jgi:hypothetical protein
MKANELRIGNWVKINDEIFEEGYLIGYDIYTTNEFQITGFNDGSSMKGCKVICFYEIPSKIFEGTIHSGCRDLDIDPITLTEEWLLRFGFEDDRDNLMVLRKDVFEFFFDKKDICGVNLYEKWDGNFLCGDIQYVHQLQNLYFALTGEELILKA